MNFTDEELCGMYYRFIRNYAGGNDPVIDSLCILAYNYDCSEDPYFWERNLVEYVLERLYNERTS